MLSFEHVPPRRCYNSSFIELFTLEQIVKLHERSGGRAFPHSPQPYPGGMGVAGLCEPCNGRTGDSYGDAFFSWTKQAANYLEKIDTAIALPFNIFPLNVIKQAAVMAIALCNASSINTPHHQQLRRAVFCPFDSGYVPKFRFFAYFCPEGFARLSHYSGALMTGVGPVLIDAEFARWPLGYVVTGDDDATLRAVRSYGLADITHFFNYPYGRWTGVHVKLPILRPRTATALTYDGVDPLPGWLKNST